MVDINNQVVSGVSHLLLWRDWRNEILKKSDIKDYMIVETGYDDKKYLVIKEKLVDDNLEGFSLQDDFNEDLVNAENKPYSISKVYKSVK